MSEDKKVEETTPSAAPEQTQTPEEQAEASRKIEAALAQQRTAMAEMKPPPTTGVIPYDADDPLSLYLNGGVFEQLQRVAKLMSAASLVPAHLQGRLADCFLVAAQAFRWRMDPFAVAQGTFVTSGKLGYEGKLVAAVVNTSRKLAGNLRYVYAGAGAQRKVTVFGRLKGETEDRVVEGTVGTWQTKNEKWQTIPDQMLSYRGAREWARRHMPEAILGVMAEDDLDGIETTLERQPDGTFAVKKPGLAGLTEKLAATAPQKGE